VGLLCATNREKYITKKIRKKVIRTRGIYLVLITLKPLHSKMIVGRN
jgi:hypothetical protein